MPDLVVVQCRTLAIQSPSPILQHSLCFLIEHTIYRGGRSHQEDEGGSQLEASEQRGITWKQQGIGVYLCV